jgi:DNA-binding CsgD family transcriptional regulator
MSVKGNPEALANLRALGHAQSSCQTVEVQNRKNDILRMRTEGMSFREIADEMGLTNGYVYKLYKKALKSIIVENVVEVRKMELARLDALQEEVIKVLREFNPLVSGGRVVYDVDLPSDNIELDEEGEPVERSLRKLPDQKLKFDAINSALKIMERRAKLLGLDAPVKAEVTGANGGPIQQQSVPSRPMTREELIAEAEARGLPIAIFQT